MSESARALFKGKLKLNKRLEDRLMQQCIKRRTAIRTEMGFLDAGATTALGTSVQHGIWRGAAYTGWAQIRAEAHLQYENDFSHRAMPGNQKRYSTLYQHFNNSVNVPARAVNVFKARACESLVNTSPFTGFMPEGQDDDGSPIKLAERLFHAALEDAEARFHFREAIKQACLSEAVMKTTLTPVGGEPELVEDAQIYMDETWNPVRDSAGGYVFSDDELEDSPDILGLKVLKRDPSVTFDSDALLRLSEPQQIPRSTPVTYKLDVRPTGWENFFCSILEPDIHAADCCFHEYDEDFDSLMKRTRGVNISPAAREWLKNLKNSAQTYPGTDGGQPQPHRGERDLEMFGPVKVHICEQWIRFDVYDRGQADELCVMWAVAAGGHEAWPIYYDLMKDASPTKKRPFEVIRIIPVRDRWYGFGFYDLLSNDHDFIDDAWNRIRARSTASGRLDVMRRDSFEGAEYGQPLSMSSGKVYVIKAGTPPGPISEHAGSIAFPEMDEKIWKMLEMALQNAQLRSGTMTAADAAMSSLPSNNTATGQDLLANESELMSNDTTQDVIRGVTATLKQCIMAVFDSYDAPSANLLLGTEAAAELQKWLATAKPADFSKHVKLLLTKARSKQALQAANAAIATLVGAQPLVNLAMTMPEVAKAMAPFYVDVLNATDTSNSDQVVKQILKATQEMIAQQQAAAAAAAAMGATGAPGAAPTGGAAPVQQQQPLKMAA